jgi:NAD(P)-dependent dehydrogenase (short-subunit alcohol dehydrogenase family)
MPEPRTTVVIGGTAGLGREVARHFAGQGDRVVLSGRDAQRAGAVAKEIGDNASGIGVDLTRPEEIAGSLAGVDHVDRLVLAAIERDHNDIRAYDFTSASRLATLKLVGYTEVVHALLDRMAEDAAILMFGGLAKDRPYPGSTTVSTVNGGVVGMVHTLAVQLAPIRVNGLHPGIVLDSPQWADKPEVHERVRSRTPARGAPAMADVVDAVDFLLRNRSVNGVNLAVDAGWLLA